MSNVSHVSTVDRGLKMKIKRTKVGPAKTEPKHEVVKGECTTSGNSAQANTGASSSSGIHILNGVPSSGSSISGSANLDKSSVGSVSSGVAGTPNKTGSGSSNNCLTSDASKDKSPKVKTPYVKKDKCKEKSVSSSVRSTADSSIACSGTNSTVGSVGGGSNSSGMSCGGGLGLGVSNGLDVLFSQVSMEPRVAVEAVAVKREMARPVLDPYEFNAKVEDGIGLPPKKLKTDTKVETASSPLLSPTSQDASTETCSIGVVTEPECLGPCEPGTSVTLEGIVWQETDNGVLVINVTWRGKTYVGTLLDATKHDWAPPRPNCESPVSDFETQLPKGRAKRGRANAGTPVSDRTVTEGRKLRKGRRGSNANFQAPPSPARSDTSNAGLKRKGRPIEDSVDLVKGDKSNNNNTKRSRSCSRGGASGTESPTPSVIECPEPNCNKKYKHINGLRYHQTHAHHHPLPVPDDEKEEEEEMDADGKDLKKNSDAEGKDAKKEALSERAERMKAKEQRRREKEREKSLEKDCSSLEDNIPLKAFANRVVAQNTDKSRSETLISKVDSTKLESSVSSAPAASTSVTSSVVTSASLSSATILSKKKDSSSVSVGMTVSKAGPVGQVYQISGVGCLGGMAVMASTNTVQAPVVTPTTAVTVCQTMPSATSIPLTVSPLATSEMNKGDSKDSNKATDKSKAKMATRPIVPALSPQVMAGQSAVVPNPGHNQLSSSLKMIQPKPTIMGEYSNVNPALADLKEKRSKSKKKKEKDGVQNLSQTPGSSPQISKSGNKDDSVHLDHTGVMKNVTSSPLGRQSMEMTPRKDNIPSIEVSKPADSPRTTVSSSTALSSSMTSPQVTLKAQDQVRTVQPPGLLKVNSPLHVSASERKTPINDDVQSPAYSDISDANDSSSPQQHDSPKKDSDTPHKKDNTSAGSSATAAGEGSGGVSHYGMYYYSRPSPYMSPNVSTTPHSSPNSTKSSSLKKDEISRPEDSRLAQTPEEARKSSMDKDSTPVVVSASKPEGLERSGPSSMATSPPQQQQQVQHPQQQMQEYQQKWLQQFYSQIRMLPQQAQYQYLAAYGMLDPFHQMHFINQQDPQYRQMMEKASEEQKRLQEQGSGKKKVETEASKKLAGSRPPSADQGTSQGDTGPGASQKLPLYGPQSAGLDRHFEGKSLVESADEREMREQALREKQNENHQIMKENIELKYQMERRQEMQERMKHEELRRMHIYQQQKDQRPPEKRKIEMQSKPPELTSSVKGHGMETSRLSVVKPEDIKKEPIDHSRVKDMSSRPQDKGGEEKRQGEKGRGGPGDAHVKSKPQDPNSGSTALTVVASSGSANPQSGPPGQFSPYTYPSMYPHYGPVQVDPTHPVYRGMNPHVIGYATAPPGAYLHPSQLGYRLNSVDSDKESSKQESKLPVPALSSEDSSKSVSESLGPQFYGGPVHKIHELQEKGRPRPSSTSPAPPGKSGESSHSGLATLSEKQREYSKSPPTQRHLHTHHHTHVLSHGFPIAYADPYSAAMFATAPHGAAPPPPAMQSSFNKP